MKNFHLSEALKQVPQYRIDIENDKLGFFTQDGQYISMRLEYSSFEVTDICIRVHSRSCCLHLWLKGYSYMLTIF